MRALTTLALAAFTLTACGPNAQTTDVSNETVVNEAVMMPEDGMSNAAMTDNGMAAMAMSTSDFVDKAAMSDMYEIASSKLALTHGESADLKKFAQKMIAGHTATTAGLKAAIAKDNVTDTPPAAMDAEHKADIDALTAKKGAAFDTLYKTQQLAAHTNALAVHQGYAASGDKAALKAFAAVTAPKVQMHLDMLKAM